MASLTVLLTALVLGNGDAHIDFDNQIIPVLTKAGCNTGACHGAAVGRGGFKLSLYGGDPAFDYRSIVLELEGRRVNFARPDQSLVLQKPTEAMAHGGGYRLEYDGAGAELLSRWIEQGSPREQTRRLEEFRVSPTTHVVDAVGTTVPPQAAAIFSDGSSVDVTAWTVFTAEDPAAVEIDPDTSIAKLLRRGRHIVTARYLDRVVPIEMMVPLSDQAVDLSQTPRNNFIDDEVMRLLTTLRIPVSPQVADATFLRRVTLDLTGRLPDYESVASFQEDTNADKRPALIERLLRSDQFNEFWTMQLAQWLRIKSQPQDTQGARTYHEWLGLQLAGGVPYDEMARQMLTSLGDTHEVGPANFYRTAAGPREQAEFASELFMGSRLRCANCHNHPLDRWTQDDYHGLAAIFAKVQQGRVIKLATRGEVTHPRTGEAARPRIPGRNFLAENTNGREAFASWLTDQDNPYFAKAIVNRLWKAMMGRGLVEPADDFRDTNPATHPALLEQLARDFVANGYDLRHTLRRIATSATYARSSRSLPENAADDRFYSHTLTRPLPPEVLADAISDVIGVPETYGDEPLGTRAVTLFDPKIKSESLDILGRCSREDSCETPLSSAGGLPQKLHMFNGKLINHRLSRSNARLVQLIAADAMPLDIVDEFYRRALSRGPKPTERKYWSEQLAFVEDPTQARPTQARPTQARQLLEDFLWSLLNCREFTTNH